MVGGGRYTYTVTSTDETLSATGRATAIADGFRVTPSDSTPARGQRITVSVTTAETLKSLPRLSVYQPGVAGYALTFTKTGSTSYRVTVTLKKAGSAGTVRFVVTGKDTAGRSNRATVLYAIH
jgi:hypothetical protein